MEKIKHKHHILLLGISLVVENYPYINVINFPLESSLLYIYGLSFYKMKKKFIHKIVIKILVMNKKKIFELCILLN